MLIAAACPTAGRTNDPLVNQHFRAKHSQPQMTTPTSFRSSIAERGSKTHELRKDSLFAMVSPT